MNANDLSRENQTTYSTQPPTRSKPVEAEDEIEDDYYDVDSSDEDPDFQDQVSSTSHHNLNLVLARSANQNEPTLPSYMASTNEPSVLSTYQPRFDSSPLMDFPTARIFYHFITITGPSLSIYERHLTNPAVIFTGAPVPTSQQSLWTYTLPMMALSNRALLHAMLALASLHIAKLQKVPPTASLRHYHYAIRRVAKAVSNPSRRTGIPTIAATLILSFYEATTGEHSKWNSHLIGARQLLMEKDFRGMQKQIKDEQSWSEGRKYYASWNDPRQGYTNYPAFSHIVQTSRQDRIDERFVDRLMGQELHYDRHGRRLEDPRTGPPKTFMTTKDIESVQVYGDLFWWYCKQDVYQSIISGNRLL